VGSSAEAEEGGPRGAADAAFGDDGWPQWEAEVGGGGGRGGARDATTSGAAGDRWRPSGRCWDRMAAEREEEGHEPLGMRRWRWR
jgi:hypothetical protein